MTDENRIAPRRPSAFMLAMGMVALVVGVAALGGPGLWAAVPVVAFSWLAVAGAIVIGVILIVSPGRRR